MRGRAAAQQLLGLALGAQAEVLVPVEFQRGGQVVHLGQAQVFGSDTGLGVGGVEDLVLEHPLRAGTTAVESVAMSGNSGRCCG